MIPLYGLLKQQLLAIGRLFKGNKMTSYRPDFDRRVDDLAIELRAKNKKLTFNESTSQARHTLLNKIAVGTYDKEEAKEEEVIEKHSDLWAVSVILTKPVATGQNIMNTQFLVWAGSKDEATGKGYADGINTANEKGYNLVMITATELDFDLLGIKYIDE